MHLAQHINRTIIEARFIIFSPLGRYMNKIFDLTTPRHTKYRYREIFDVLNNESNAFKVHILSEHKVLL